MQPVADYWAVARHAGGWRAELAGCDAVTDWGAVARALFGLSGAEPITVQDRARGTLRLAFMNGSRVRAALFVAPHPVALSRDHLAAAVGLGDASLLAGWPGCDVPDPGPTICACLSVGRTTILTAIAGQRLTSVQAIVACTGAGTSCGSCKPELAALLSAAIPRLEAAE
jgi:assimilatory nitrate reductase catalytic subunit